jgi:hypothetical protein
VQHFETLRGDSAGDVNELINLSAASKIAAASLDTNNSALSVRGMMK